MTTDTKPKGELDTLVLGLQLAIFEQYGKEGGGVGAPEWRSGFIHGTEEAISKINRIFKTRYESDGNKLSKLGYDASKPKYRR